ncbi:hypothetical protein HDU86_006953 [Geranomyces michiganensis]|nr:hypothetical protein HDU86_006953 [Geranomyces michiganensis]
MKSPIAALALTLLALLNRAAQAEPVFSYEPTYEAGKTYLLTVDFGIMDRMPENLTFAYGPAPVVGSLQAPLALQTQFKDIGPATKVPGTGSATRRGTEWTPSTGDLAAFSPGQKFVLAVHGSDKPADGAASLWEYWKVAPQTQGFVINTGMMMTMGTGGVSRTASATASATASVTVLVPVVIATPAAGSGSASSSSSSAAAGATGAAAAAGGVQSGAAGGAAAVVGPAAIIVAGSLSMLIAAM